MTDRPTKRQQQAAATQDQLLQAAREVFQEKGYQAATVGAITRAAQTAHGTFYLYFKNKEDAFGRVMSDVTDELYREAGARWAKGHPYEALEAATRGFLEVFVANRGLWRCLLEGTFQSEAIEELWLGIRRRFTERVARNLDQLRGEEAIRPLDPTLTAHALGAMVEWFAFTHFVLNEPPVDDASFETSVRLLTDLWFHAVYTDATPAGVPAPGRAPG